MSRKDPQFNLRISEDLKQYLADQAKANHRSQTAEVISRLERSRSQDAQNERA